MLFSEYDLKAVLLPRDKFKPFPVCGEFCPNDDIRKAAVNNAEKYIGFDWGFLSAASYMQFSRDGNRTNYENINFARRKALACLVLGEYAENKGRFTDDIINGIWAICEESTWVIPAHNGGMPLPSADKPNVDLFSAQTSALLAFAYYLLYDKLNNVSTAITERIEREVTARVTDAVLNCDYWWMEFGENRRKQPSNWTSWCSSTSLASCLLIEKDAEKRIKVIQKLLDIMDYYISAYPDDGGCDEGADYWSMSAGCMFDFLEMLYRASDGKIDIFDNPKIKRMGEYIYRVHITGDYFVNFADCSAKADIGGARTYLFGKRVKSDNLAVFGMTDYIAKSDKTVPDTMNMLHKLFAVTLSEDNKADKFRNKSYKREYIESLQLLNIQRDGMALCIKGGHNADNHNHNDVGSYMVYADGKPIIIDVGVESYTKKTFSSERYTIWTMQSAYHNLPTINGIMQHDGGDYHADNINVGENYFECDIKNAYPKEAEIIYWKRRSSLGDNGITITDDFELENPSDDVQISVMTWDKPVVCGGEIRVNNVKIEYPVAVWGADIERIDIDYDAKLTPVWGECVYRIVFYIKERVKKNKFEMRIRRI